MRLKRKNSSAPLLLAILVSGVLLVVAAMQTSVEQVTENFEEYILALDPGYSRFPGVTTLLSELPRIVEGKINGFEIRPELETVYVDINPQEYRTLLQDRDRAIEAMVLAEPREVNAKIRFNGKQMKADVRLKGDLRDHWISKHRMSLRVKLKNDNSLLGYNEFSIQKPYSRQHPFDAVFQEVARTSGNLASVHEYVNVVFNGKPWGIMIMEEAMTSEFLEKLDRKESLIVRFSNEDKGIMDEQSNLLGIPVYENYKLSDDRLFLKMYEENKYSQDLNFRKWFTHIAQHRAHGTEEQAALYDVDSYGRALFLSAIWNDGHQLWYPNIRHYFNPYTLKLEPITTDAFLPISLRGTQMLFPRGIFDPINNNTVFNSVMATAEFQDKVESFYAEAVASMSQAKDVYGKYHAYFPMDPKIDMVEVVLEDNIFNLNYKPNRDTLFAPRDIPSRYLEIAPDSQQVALLADLVHIRHFDDGRVEIFNLLPDTVYLDRIIVDDIVEFVIDRELPPFRPEAQDSLIIETPFTGFLDGRLAISTRYADQSRLTHSGLSLVTQGMHNPLLQDSAPDAYPFLSWQDDHWQFEQGNWEISSPLVLQGDLVVPEGTTVCFADSAYLIVKGAMLAEGNEEAPILLQPCAQSWKGVFVLNANEESSWSHVRVRDYAATADGLLNLTGGITFYKADVRMENVQLSGVQGEDALNLVHSSFQLNNLGIRDTTSDGLDSDFSTGTISNAVLSNINGDALDFSGSTVVISNITANNIYDKAVSVGEASDVEIQGGNINDVGVAVVSKDGSNTSARDLVIGDYVLAGAMSYQKKSFYPAANLALENITVRGESPFIRQTGSGLTYNGTELSAQNIDVDYLYENTVMKK